MKLVLIGCRLVTRNIQVAERTEHVVTAIFLSQNKTRLVSFWCKGEHHGTILEFMFFIILNMYANEANAPGTTITACIIVCLKFHSEVSDQILLACDFTK